MIAQKISVLFDAHNLGKKQGGIETYNKNLIRALSKKGVNLIPYTNNTAKIKNAYLPPFDHGLYRIFVGFNKATKEKEVDIIHTNNFLPYPAPRKVRKILTMHDLCFLEEKPPLTKSFLSSLILHSLRNANQIIATSNFTRNQIVNFGGKDMKKKIKVIYQGVDKTFKKMNKRNALNELGNKYGTRGRFLLFSGNITKRKNIEKLIHAAKIANRYKLKLVISGRAPSNRKLPENIIVLGHVSLTDLNLLYNATEALIYLSSCEGFGLPIIEAMSLKTPVICSDIKVFREVAKNAAIFVKNKKELEYIIEKIIKNKKLRRKFAEKGYNRSKSFSWDKTAKETLKVYRQILSGV
jgi:glycosyltransferase involved in cell wall biosynthesis